MQQTIAACFDANAAGDPMLQQLPDWVARSTCEIKPVEGKRPGYRLSFHCCCCVKPVRISANKPRAGWASNKTEQVAEMFRDAVISQHEQCADRSKGATAIPTVREQQLEATVKTAKRKLRNAKSTIERQSAELDSAEASKKACSEAKRQETLAANRRSVEVDPSNTEMFTAANKSTALHADKTGMIDTIRYWVQGSAERVLQLLIALMAAFGIREQVAVELKAEAEGVNADIVSRLHGSLQILKQCETEEQRQHYRVVLTSVAPKPVKERDPTGRERDFADALGVNRNGKPWCDSVDKRVEIDAALKIKSQPLKVGDTVVCRHGAGTLVEYAGHDGPCAVKLIVQTDVGAVEHVSRFDYAKKCKGGGSVRHAPISFAHTSRAARKDQIPDHVKKQVATASQMRLAA